MQIGEVGGGEEKWRHSGVKEMSLVHEALIGSGGGEDVAEYIEGV